MYILNVWFLNSEGESSQENVVASEGDSKIQIPKLFEEWFKQQLSPQQIKICI